MIKYFKLDNSFGSVTGDIPKGAKEITEGEYNIAVDSIYNEINTFVQNDHKNMIRLSELQDKAVLEGLTGEEKEEYKKLKGGE